MAEPLSDEEQRRCDEAGKDAERVVKQAFADAFATLPPIRAEHCAMIAPEELETLRAENARLRPLAKSGEALNALPVGFGLSHAADNLWLVWDSRGGEDVDETCGPTPLVALNKLAELLVGEDEAR